MEKRLEGLAVNIPLPQGDFRLKTPVIAASGTFGYGLEFERYGSLSDLGGMVTKGLSLRPKSGNPMPRIAETCAGMLNAIGLQNCGVERFIREYLPRLPHEGLQIIANIYATSLEDFGELAAILSREPGIGAIEVNISCPNVSCGGMLFGQNPLEAAKVTEAVKKHAGKVPVIVKLSPNVTNIAEIARACAGAGADMLSCINTLGGMGVDIRTRRPLLANNTGGLSGPAIKPVALKAVWEVSRAVNIPVIGIGGISCAEDILEFIMVGAWAVQVGTANFASPERIFRLGEELSELMHKLNIKSCASFRNTLQPY